MSGTSPGTVPGSVPAHGTSRLLLVLVGAAAVAAGLVRYALWLVAPGTDGLPEILDALAGVPTSSMPVDQVVVLLVLAGGAAAAGWIALSTLVALVYVLAGRAGHRWRAGEILLERVAPAAVRRLARSAVGVGVGAGLVLAPSAAFAADTAPESPPDHAVSVTVDAPAASPVDLGWRATTPSGDVPAEAVPRSTVRSSDAPASGVTTTDATPGPRTPAPAAATPVVRNLRPAHDDEAPTHVVLRGDTLWDLATRALGGTPSDAELLREVSRWHSANRDVIGDDPDVILPGQVLHVPG